MPNLHVAAAITEPASGADTHTARPVLRLFAAARQAAGTGNVVLAGDTVGAVLDAATARYGRGLETVLAASRVWLNGEPTDRGAVVADHDEIAVLPPVSGGA